MAFFLYELFGIPDRKRSTAHACHFWWERYPHLPPSTGPAITLYYIANIWYWFVFRLDEYLTVIENYRNSQKKENEDSQPVDGNPEQPPGEKTQNGQNNNPVEDSHTNGAEADSTESSEESENEAQKKKKSRKKSKRNTSKLFNKRASLKIQIDKEALRKFPKLKEVTCEKVEEIRTNYDLPKFPPAKNLGPASVFSETEEKQMINYLKEMSSQGFPRTIYQFQSELQYYYQNYCNDKKKKGYVFGMYYFTINIEYLQIVLRWPYNISCHRYSVRLLYLLNTQICLLRLKLHLMPVVYNSIRRIIATVYCLQSPDFYTFYQYRTRLTVVYDFGFYFKGKHGARDLENFTATISNLQLKRK